MSGGVTTMAGVCHAKHSVGSANDAVSHAKHTVGYATDSVAAARACGGDTMSGGATAMAGVGHAKHNYHRAEAINSKKNYMLLAANRHHC